MIKRKAFYSSLVDLEDLEAEINNFPLSDEERYEIIHIVDDILHHKVMDSIMNILPVEHHKKFVEWFSQTPHDQELLDFLREHATTDPEAKILTVTEVVKREIVFDLLQAKPKKKKH